METQSGHEPKADVQHPAGMEQVSVLSWSS